MATTATETATPSVAAPWPVRARLAGWALLVGWVLLVGTAVFTGERSSSLSDLQSAADSGDVTVVRVSGGLGDSASARGFATLELHWREGLFRYRAEVREARPLRAGRTDGDVPVVRAGVVTRLQASHPDLRIVSLPDDHPSSFSGSMLGSQLPPLLVWGGLALGLTTLCLLIAGPQPWRATRWAWFWILGVATPLGLLSYLVLGGPTALSPAPRPGAGRLTGGWAFLLAFVVSSIIAAVASSFP